jgi:o-succinylbenzoate synthase
MIRATFEKKTFHFKRPSGTSRGVLTEKHAWFISLSDSENPSIIGLGECSIIPGLSPDFVDFEQYENQVKFCCDQINSSEATFESIAQFCDEIIEFPSIVFGIETALLDLRNGGKSFFYDTSFTRSETKIPINGLIWMGDEAFMQAQIEDKLKEGFRCIKMKIGAIEFDKEFAILESLRERFPADQLTLRVDANGAFSLAEALDRLTQLATLEIHSIEQPIQVNQWDAMAELCQKSPLPIALDEELIGIHDLEAKRKLLESIQPQYIILKPSLHGGIAGTKSWIQIAEKLNIPWWITSALESNVGLNHIAQFTSTYDNLLFQGLGTGGLYVENTPTKMQTKGGFLEMIV